MKIQYCSDLHMESHDNMSFMKLLPLEVTDDVLVIAGDRAAIVYSLLASCRAADVDPRQWLEHVLVEIPTRKKNGIPLDDLRPMAYAGCQETEASRSRLS